MSRLKENCPGDCSTCPLLADGRVDMVPCVLDQMFRRLQTLSERVESINESLKSPSGKKFASREKQAKDVQGNDDAGEA